MPYDPSIRCLEEEPDPSIRVKLEETTPEPEEEQIYKKRDQGYY